MKIINNLLINLAIVNKMEIKDKIKLLRNK
jgi:hypothetical protein